MRLLLVSGVVELVDNHRLNLSCRHCGNHQETLEGLQLIDVGTAHAARLQTSQSGATDVVEGEVGACHPAALIGHQVGKAHLVGIGGEGANGLGEVGHVAVLLHLLLHALHLLGGQGDV